MLVKSYKQREFLRSCVVHDAECDTSWFSTVPLEMRIALWGYKYSAERTAGSTKEWKQRLENF